MVSMRRFMNQFNFIRLLTTRNSIEWYCCNVLLSHDHASYGRFRVCRSANAKDGRDDCIMNGSGQWCAVPFWWYLFRALFVTRRGPYRYHYLSLLLVAFANRHTTSRLVRLCSQSDAKYMAAACTDVRTTKRATFRRVCFLRVCAPLGQTNRPTPTSENDH